MTWLCCTDPISAVEMYILLNLPLDSTALFFTWPVLVISFYLFVLATPLSYYLPLFKYRLLNENLSNIFFYYCIISLAEAVNFSM